MAAAAAVAAEQKTLGCLLGKKKSGLRSVEDG